MNQPISSLRVRLVLILILAGAGFLLAGIFGADVHSRWLMIVLGGGLLAWGIVLLRQAYVRARATRGPNATNGPLVIAASLAAASVLTAAWFLIAHRHRQQASAGLAGVPSSTSDKAEVGKLQSVISCWNEPISGIIDDAERYQRDERSIALSGSDPAQAQATLPTHKLFMGDSPANQTGQGSRDCADALEKAASARPAMPGVDEGAPRLAAALRDLAGPGAAMDQYLSQKGYLDDHGEKGRRIDAQLSPVLARLTSAGQQLYDGMQAEHAKLERSRLEALERQGGQSIDWRAQHALSEARLLSEDAQSLASRNRLDSAALQKLIDPLQRDYDAAQAYVSAHPALGRPGTPSQPLWMALSDNIAKELSDAKDLRRTLDTPQSDPDRTREIRSGVEQLTSSYNFVAFANNNAQR